MKIRSVLIIIIFMINCAPVFGGFFSADPIKIKQEEDRKFYAKIGGLFLRDETSWLASVDSEAGYDDGRLDTGIGFKKERSRTANDELLKNTQKLQAGIDYFIHKHIEIFTFHVHEYDTVNDLMSRYTGGLGLKFVINRIDLMTTDFSAAPVYEYEDLRDSAGTKTLRYSFRFRNRLTPFENVINRVGFFYVPLWDDWHDYRFEAKEELELKITSVFSLTLKHVYTYETRPAGQENFSENKTRLFFTLSY